MFYIFCGTKSNWGYGQVSMHTVYLEYFVVSERYSFLVTCGQTWSNILGSVSEVSVWTSLQFISSVLDLLQDPLPSAVLLMRP